MRELEKELEHSLLDELKNRLHITMNDDDNNLLELIRVGYSVIQSYCGEFDITENGFGKNLVFEYCRFQRNGVAEHFYDSYVQDLVVLGFELSELGDDEDVSEKKRNS